MSGQTEVIVGLPVYLEAQLYDEEVSLPLVVKALIYKVNGTLLATVVLVHTEKGIFVDGSYLMPDEPVLYVKYYVFENDGVTSKTSDYGIIGEKFVRKVITSVVNVIGEPIQGVLLDMPDLVGGFPDIIELNGIITDNALSGTITDGIVLEGVVLDE